MKSPESQQGPKHPSQLPSYRDHSLELCSPGHTSDTAPFRPPLLPSLPRLGLHLALLRPIGGLNNTTSAVARGLRGLVLP